MAALALLSKLDIKAKRYGDAQRRLERVLTRRPSDATALNNLAWVYMTQGDPRARGLAQRAYFLAPTPDAADTLGWTLVRQGDARAAVPLLRQSSKERQGDPSILYHLAVALRDDGKPDEALAVLRGIDPARKPFDEAPEARTLLQTLQRTP